MFTSAPCSRNVGISWYSTWASQGALPALTASSIFAYPPDAPVGIVSSVTWMFLCVLLNKFTALEIFGTQVQNVRWVTPPEDDDELVLPQAETAATRTTTSPASQRAGRDRIRMTPPAPRATRLLRGRAAKDGAARAGMRQDLSYE